MPNSRLWDSSVPYQRSFFYQKQKTKEFIEVLCLKEAEELYDKNKKMNIEKKLVRQL